MSAQHLTHLPRRPQTARKYLRIMKFACGRNKQASAVARRFGCSEATVINASKAFGLTYDQVRRQRSLPRVAEIERLIPLKDALSARDRHIVDGYNSKDAPTLQEIGVKFNLSRQRVHQILSHAMELGVRVAERSKPIAGHWFERCDLCRRLVGISRESPLITTRRLADRLNTALWTLYWHLQKLRARNLVPSHFARFRSERIIHALEVYNHDRRLSATAVGRMIGYKNLSGAFLELRRRGMGNLMEPRIRKAHSSPRPSAVVRLFHEDATAPRLSETSRMVR